MSELVSLLDVVTVVGADGTSEQALDSTLQIVLREVDVEQAALFVRTEDGCSASGPRAGFRRGHTPLWMTRHPQS